jgi:hypothetical protein
MNFNEFWMPVFTGMTRKGRMILNDIPGPLVR